MGTVWSTHSIRVKNPVVLVHGIGARAHYGPVDYFYGLPELLKREGIPFLTAKLSPWKSYLERAHELRRQILERFPDQKVNLIGHSMGGLDSRYLISRLHFAERVESLTTIGTPHGGSSLAQLALRPMGGRTARTARRFFSSLGYPIGALERLTPQFARTQLEKLAPAHPDVAYYSLTSAIPRKDFARRSLPLFWLSNRWLRKLEGENDGIVSVESSRYGETLAVFPGDHYGQIGQLLGRSRGLDYPGLYRMILRKLRHRGH
jgi:triacylglycerol lipase